MPKNERLDACLTCMLRTSCKQYGEKVIFCNHYLSKRVIGWTTEVKRKHDENIIPSGSSS